jgi:MFS family permease
MSGRDGVSTTSVNSLPAPAARDRRHGSGFWTVAYAYLIVMAFATLPSPLYGLYRTRDHLSAFMITVIYAIFATGTIASLLAVRVVAVRIGRRGVMLAAVATMMVGAGLLAAWKALPGLLVGRFTTGVSVGLAAGTAITYLIELRLRADPKASVVRAQTIGTSVTVGGLGIGALIGGLLAQWGKLQLTLPYLVFVALGAAALAGLWFVPETGLPTPHPAARSTAARSARLPVPAAAGTLAAFAANGLFAGLAGLFLATTLHHPSHALSGAALFLVFSCGVLSQLMTAKLSASRVLALGTLSMLAGLVLLVVFRATLDPEPGPVPDRRGPDRRRRRGGVQRDHRDRAGRQRTRKPPGHDLGSPHRPLPGTVCPGGRGRDRPQPGRQPAQHCVRLRHPGRAGRLHLRMGAPTTQARKPER